MTTLIRPPTDDVIRLLEEDHQSIARALAASPKCKLPPSEAACADRSACPHVAECRASIRKMLASLLYMSIEHFDRERETLRGTVYREDMERHDREHLAFIQSLTDMLANYGRTGDCRVAIDGIDHFATAIHEHMRTTDMAMLCTGVPGQ